MYFNNYYMVITFFFNYLTSYSIIEMYSCFTRKYFIIRYTLSSWYISNRYFDLAFILTIVYLFLKNIGTSSCYFYGISRLVK